MTRQMFRRVLLRRPAGAGPPVPRLPARNGVSSIEVVVALGLLTATLSTTLPLFVRHARLLTESRQERVAIEELANQAERLSALDPAARAAFLEAPHVSPVAAAGLPGARLTVRLAGSPLGRQATLRLSWHAEGRREHPLELVVWLAEAVRNGRQAGPPAAESRQEGPP